MSVKGSIMKKGYFSFSWVVLYSLLLVSLVGAQSSSSLNDEEYYSHLILATDNLLYQYLFTDYNDSISVRYMNFLLKQTSTPYISFGYNWNAFFSKNGFAVNREKVILENIGTDSIRFSGHAFVSHGWSSSQLEVHTSTDRMDTVTRMHWPSSYSGMLTLLDSIELGYAQEEIEKYSLEKVAVKEGRYPREDYADLTGVDPHFSESAYFYRSFYINLINTEIFGTNLPSIQLYNRITLEGKKFEHYNLFLVTSAKSNVYTERLLPYMIYDYFGGLDVHLLNLYLRKWIGPLEVWFQPEFFHRYPYISRVNGYVNLFPIIGAMTTDSGMWWWKTEMTGLMNKLNNPRKGKFAAMMHLGPGFEHTVSSPLFVLPDERLENNTDYYLLFSGLINGPILFGFDMKVGTRHSSSPIIMLNEHHKNVSSSFYLTSNWWLSVLF
jgi:hypothetical protein